MVMPTTLTTVFMLHCRCKNVWIIVAVVVGNSSVAFISAAATSTAST